MKETEKSASKPSTKIETGVGPVTDQILNTVLTKLDSDTFKTTLMEKLFSPLSNSINTRIRPYIMISAGLYFIVVVLILIIIFLLVRRRI